MLMEIAELERMERSARQRLMTSAQRSARLREVENMRRIQDAHNEVCDPEVSAEGLAKAREALRTGLAQTRD